MNHKFYYKDGTTASEYDTSKELHREDGPAAEHTNGTKGWYVNGKCHRVDGPAVEYTDGTKSWYIDNKRYTKEEFNELMKEVKRLSPVLRLIDPREWVRKTAEMECMKQ